MIVSNLSRPPPEKDFWNQRPCAVKLPEWTQPFTPKLTYWGSYDSALQSGQLNSAAKYPETMEVRAEDFGFGILTAPLAMKPMYRTTSKHDSPITLSHKLRFKEIEITFPLFFRGDGDPTAEPIRNNRRLFKLVMSHTSDIKVWEVMHFENKNIAILVISVATPPLFYRKFPEHMSHTAGANKWDAKQAWWRQTDISYDPSEAKTLPTSLKRAPTAINIGRWTTYRVQFDFEKCGIASYEQLCNGFRDFNIRIERHKRFLFDHGEHRPVWDYIDRRESSLRSIPSTSLAQLMDDEFSPLPFEVRYQLEVCISEGWLNEYCMTKIFIHALRNMDVPNAVELLEFVSSQRRRHFDPMEIFQLVITTPPRRKVPIFCTLLRAVTVTPTTVVFSSATLEISNRVLRQYREHADRFLRVRFTEEKTRGKIYATRQDQMNEVFSRIKRTMTNGIAIGDRQYEFLAFGNSQFREHGAFFFAAVPHLNAAKIRRWMGDFQGINIVAKYAARLGQCFSTTRAISGVRATIAEASDIKSADGKYNFSDGVGMVSSFLAYMAANETGALLPSGDPPSVMQFRLGGAKGVLTVWPQAKQRDIHMRKSQFKFSAAYEGLEVVRWSQFAAAHLNRQLITVLSARGVSDAVFIEKLQSQVGDLNAAMSDEAVALRILQKEVDPNQMSLTLATMILDGFQTAREPFMMSLLKLWKAFSLKYLKEKAKIAVHQGAVLLGCVDESGKLKGYFKAEAPEEPMDNNIDALPEIFVQLSKGKYDRPQVITGLLAVARNPSLFAGDIQVVRGVDIPELRHIKDAAVFPRTGDRDIPNMLSGGDLDGDDFIVIWDPALIPTSWHEQPSEFTASTPQRLNREPTMDDVTSFFVQYMQNDSLPKIAMAHLATADATDLSVRDPRCVELAQLHSRAVDYPKNGEIATMPPQLEPAQWPHFMDRRSGRRYQSKKALGQLYNLVVTENFAPDYEDPFHEGILNAFVLEEERLQTARGMKRQYDQAMRRIMLQHDIKTEFEVWSTFVMSHAKLSNDYKFAEQIGHQSSALKETFRDECIAKAGGRDFDTLAPFVAAMYKVTQQEIMEAREKQEAEDALKRQAREARAMELQGSEDPEGQERLAEDQPRKHAMPFMSFPWLFPTVLGQIASGQEKSALGPFKRLNIWTRPKQKPAKTTVQSPKEDPDAEDVLHTKDGVAHVGDTLTLFQHDDAQEADPKGKEVSEEKIEASAAPEDPGSTTESPESPLTPVRKPGIGADSSSRTSPQPPSPKEELMTFESPSSISSRSENRRAPCGVVDVAPSILDMEVEEARSEERGAVEEVNGGEDAETEDADDGMEEIVELQISSKPSPFEQLARLNEE